MEASSRFGYLGLNNVGHPASESRAMVGCPFRQLWGLPPLFISPSEPGAPFLPSQFKAALEEYQRALTEQPSSSIGWNGIGLVLVELKRFEDARNAFGRAVDADADFAAAHYNLSFVLSQLGDFDSALRETRRALELEPLYVPQKFALTIDLRTKIRRSRLAPELVADCDGESSPENSVSILPRSTSSSTSLRHPAGGTGRAG